VEKMIVINTVEFPLISMNKMHFIREKYHPNMDIPIDIPTLESIKEFMIQFPTVNRKILLPRIDGISYLLSKDIYMWLSTIDRENILSMVRACMYLQYDELYEILCMHLSTDFYIQEK
jgi:hypothetical protein